MKTNMETFAQNSGAMKDEIGKAFLYGNLVSFDTFSHTYPPILSDIQTINEKMTNYGDRLAVLIL